MRSYRVWRSALLKAARDVGMAIDLHGTRVKSKVVLGQKSCLEARHLLIHSFEQIGNEEIQIYPPNKV